MRHKQRMRTALTIAALVAAALVLHIVTSLRAIDAAMALMLTRTDQIPRHVQLHMPTTITLTKTTTDALTITATFTQGSTETTAAFIARARGVGRDLCGVCMMNDTIQPTTVHPSIVHVLAFFKFAHLPERLQVISRPFCELAEEVANRAPQNQETTVALRKLLEAKDAAVRAAL